ncbi:uncharacterized protein TNCV_2152731 [Trichonephila clavipes]|nr:uncharacterized protein TNCV_2152731 [Trichonephila clavipes]
MLRISGSFSAENCVKAAETKLQEFGITTEKHIVACVTDGASMMVKFGKIMTCEYHLCYAHAIHLAVCDVLYNKQIDLVENTVEVEDNSHEEEDNGESEELAEDLEFESGFGCEKMVCLDTKTRWNNLLAMLEIFLEIKSEISKALIDIKEEQMRVNVEFETVTTNVKGLKPVKIGLEKLCSRNGLMQYLNFGRKYEAAAVTGDISRLPGKNCLVRQAQMIGTRLFCEEEESISNFSHSEEESIEILKEKPLALDEKLEKAIYSKTKVL